MRIVLSRKGFDSTAGGAPSPIVDGRPVSLPIPAIERSVTSYAALGHGERVEAATRGRIAAESLCHDDPMFADGDCWFGQCDAAQGHLARNGVAEGDVFLFFGLFAGADGGEKHHRIFGYLRIACCGSPEAVRKEPAWREPPRPHPHFIGRWPANNALYFGPGRTASRASPTMRLTLPGGPLNHWCVPPWLKGHGLTYHGKPDRWLGETGLHSVKRGQEFVCNIGDAPEPRMWLDAMIAEIENRDVGTGRSSP